MDIETYQKLQIVYCLLSNRFSEIESDYKGIYKSYDPNISIVKDENLEILKKFQDISNNDLSLETNLVESDWGTSSLVKILANEVLISHDLEIIIYYFLIHTFSAEINEILNSLDDFQKKYPLSLIWKNEKSKLLVKQTIQDLFFENMNNIQNANMVRHLLEKVSYNFIMAQNSFDVVFETDKIKNAIRTSKEYNFDLLNKKFS